MAKILKLLIFSLCIVSVLTAIICIRLLWGRTLPTPQSIEQLHLLACKSPCWVGIVPSLTTVEEAMAKTYVAYGSTPGLKIKSSWVTHDYVGMEVEGNRFDLIVRLNVTKMIDAKSEIVRAVDICEGRGDSTNYSPSLVDILATFGVPRQISTEKLAEGNGYIVTLRYDGLDITYYEYTDGFYAVGLNQPIYEPCFSFKNRQ